MNDTADRAIAIVGLGAILPDAPDVDTFWSNVQGGVYSISDVPVERWDPDLYWDPDPAAPDKSYSRIGGWVREAAWDPFAWRLPIPPAVSDQMDGVQRWAVSATRAALSDFGWPDRALDPERTAVILGNAMAGERHYMTSMRIHYPEFQKALEGSPGFCALPPEQRAAIAREAHAAMDAALPPITEDTMPGELSNCIAGRIANLFNFRGPNYVVDAACASAMAAMSAAVEGLVEGDFDAVVSGGVDRNMGPSTFVKFCKIGALSATGTRPYAEGADGFVMGEGAVLFILKRLADAERDGDRIHAVLRAMGGSSDGRGKGITAPNPVGQRLALERAWANAGLSPASAGFVEGHGTSTRVGDVVEVGGLTGVFGGAGAAPGSIRLGSVKSNIGHLKGAAGAAGLLKATLALRDRIVPPSLNCETPNPKIDFAAGPFRVNGTLEPWDLDGREIRRAGVSAFGFGGTNFHAVLEEHVPGRLTDGRKTRVAVAESPDPAVAATNGSPPPAPASPAGPEAGPAGVPFGSGILVGAGSEAELVARLQELKRRAEAGEAPEPELPSEADLRAPERVAIDFSDADDLARKVERSLQALEGGRPGRWTALAAQGVFRGSGAAAPVAFLFTGQGSQYVDMLAELRGTEAVVADTFAEADEATTPLLGRPLSSFVFAGTDDPGVVAEAEEALKQTAITQPAVLTVDTALARLLEHHGVRPAMTMGHSLGEYGALVAAGAMTFPGALEAVSARGREMTRVSLDDNGAMAAVFAPPEQVEDLLARVDGYVVVANINSSRQAVIGGEASAVEAATGVFAEADVRCVPLQVSHAFHTRIVAPASEPLRRALDRIEIAPSRVPVVSNVTGDFYPADRTAALDLLARQVASPVQFVKGLETLWNAGARVFVEVGPKRALTGFVQDVLGDRDDARWLFTNHPKMGDRGSFNRCLWGLYAAGHGHTRESVAATRPSAPSASAPPTSPRAQPEFPMSLPADPAASTPRDTPAGGPDYGALGRIFAEALERGMALMSGHRPPRTVVVSGAALGLPGAPRLFDEGNVARILGGDTLLGPIPEGIRDAMAGMGITRLVKGSDGSAAFRSIDDPADVIKLAGRAGAFDLAEEFDVRPERVDALSRTTRLAMAAGIDALRDAGLPLVQTWRTTSKGTLLPDGWRLPESLRDETGVIFASAFPGLDVALRDASAKAAHDARAAELARLRELRRGAAESGDDAGADALSARIDEVAAALEAAPFRFDRRYLFQLLSMGHAQFAEEIGARGPNTQINSACASTTQALALAQDWIQAGRCRRVIVIAADDVTEDGVLEWIGSGFLATGAAATDENVEDAALPFDRRRHGMLLGMGAAALVVEDREAAEERGLRPICRVLGTATANSAFHGTRLDVDHIAEVMEGLIAQAESRWGLDRRSMAPQLVFMSHETYTPARGGSAAAEVHALRRVFGPDADRVVIANTKGYTGHPMGVGIEDVVVVKALETGIVPPVPNFREVDPELGSLNLSRGGPHPVRFALRLGAGFGSQVSMSLLEWMPGPSAEARPAPDALGYETRLDDPPRFRAWLTTISGDPEPRLEVHRHRLRVVDPRRSGVESPAAGPSAPPEAPVTPPGAPEATGSPTAPGVEPALDPVVGAADSAEPAAAPVPAEVPPAAAMEAAPPSGTPADVDTTILEIVADKTGYPPDMLDMELDLEADLGIDTVKQAEVFAAIRERWGIQRDEALQLRDYPTLQHVAGFVRERMPAGGGEAAPAPAATTASTAAPPAAPTAEPPVAAASTAPADIEATILEIVADKTGYPPDMLDMELDLEADLGIDTVKQAEMFAAIRERWGIQRDEALQLRDYPTLQHVAGFVRERMPQGGGEAAPAPAATTASTAAPPAGVPEAAPDRTDATAAGHEPEAPPAPPIPEPATPEGALADIEATILEIVADKTGYPPDMLDMELDLEADLGIDTVKQAEMFAAIRERWGIQRDEALQLRDYPTLQHVAGFVRERMPRGGVGDADSAADTVTGTPGTFDGGLDAGPIAGPPPTEPAGVAPVRPVPGVFAELRGDEAAAAALPRRLARLALLPHRERFEPTAAGPEAGSVVAIMPDAGGVYAELAARLGGRGVRALILPPSEPGTWEALLRPVLETGELRGLYWLPALDADPDPGEAELAEWRLATALRVKALHRVVRLLGPDFADAHRFVVAGTRMGGAFGYDGAGRNPLGGAVSGFVKALARERPSLLCKVVDVGPVGAAHVARDLLDETLFDRGPVEVGLQNGDRWGVTLVETPMDETGTPSEAGTPVSLGPDTVFVVTGAAGSIVAAIAGDLARRAGGGHFHLLDLAAAPNPDDPELFRLSSDREGLQRDVFQRLSAEGDRVTPVQVQRELARLEREEAALAAMRLIEAAGGTATYHSVNLLDPDLTRAAVEEIVRRHGRVDVLIHAAGLEISRRIEDKAPEEFDRVFDVKADGWFNLLRALGPTPLGAAVVFSSVAGRFGNAGQTDYSAANDFLVKSASVLASERGVRGLALDWTAWRDIGMASRGSIPRMMAEAGIDMLPPEAGLPIVGRELVHGDGFREFVVGLGLGRLLEGTAPAGGAPVRSPARTRVGPMTTGEARYDTWTGFTVETELDPTAQPFLYDHRIDGTPVLPGVMGIEGFAELAAVLAPDWHLIGIENVVFHAPFKFYRDEARRVRLRGIALRDGGGLRIRVRLEGVRHLESLGEERETLHFSGEVRMGRGPAPSGEGADAVLDSAVADALRYGGRIEPGGGAAARDAVYRVYFHGPAYQVVGSAWSSGSDTAVARMAAHLDPDVRPADATLRLAPRWIELCFQTAGVLELSADPHLRLPAAVEGVRTLGGNGASPVYAVVRRRPDGAFDAEILDGRGRALLRVDGYRTVASPATVDEAALTPLRAGFEGR